LVNGDHREVPGTVVGQVGRESMVGKMRVGIGQEIVGSISTSA
jgi:hypothetical protein